MKKKTKRDKKTFKTAVSEMAKRLRWHVYANAYQMDICWHLDEYGPPGPHGGHVGASMSVDYSYCRLTLTIFKGVLDMYLGGKPIFPVLVHEFIHFITMPMYQRARNLVNDQELENVLHEMNERETEMITNMLLLEGEESLQSVKKWDR